jgi:hypothetical protein
MTKKRFFSLFLAVVMLITTIPVITVTTSAGYYKGEWIVCNTQTDDELAKLGNNINHGVLRGVGSANTLFDVDTNSKTVTVTNRGGTSQGINVVASSINDRAIQNNWGKDNLYRIDYTGYFPNNPNAVARIRMEATGETLAVDTATNGSFSLSVIRSAQQIAEDAKTANGGRYSLGNASGNIDIVYTGVVVTMIPFNAPDTEVKFLLNADLMLDEEGELLREFRDWDGLFAERPRGRIRNVAMQYMDTPNKIFQDNGFTIRVRHRNWRQPNEGYQITYRKRIPIPSVDHFTVYKKIESDEVQDFLSNGWEMSIDWGYDSAFLTLDYEVDTTNKITPVTAANLPEADIFENYPELFPQDVKNMFGSDLTAAFNDVVAHGPVSFDRYEYRFPELPDNRELRIESAPARRF